MNDISAAPTPPVRSRLRAWLRRLVVVLVVMVIWSAWNYIEARRLARAMEALHEREISLGLQPPPAEPPQHVDDAARLYDAAADLAVDLEGRPLFTKVISESPGPLSAEEAAAAHDMISENALALDLVGRAEHVPMRESDAKLRDRSRGRQLGQLFNVLSFRTCALARTGQFDAAATALVEKLAVLRMFDRVEPRAPVSTMATKARTLSRATDDLVLVLSMGRPSAPWSERLARAFAIDLSRDFDRVLSWEIRMLSDMTATVPLRIGFTYTATGTSVPSFTPPLIETLLLPSIRREHARTADAIAETIDVRQQAVRVRLERLKAIAVAQRNQVSFVTRPWSIRGGIVDFSVASALDIASADARARCAIVALAIERFRGSTGRSPAALSELTPTYLDAVPVDPFDGAPLRYRLDAARYSVYSVGENGKDDGGDFETKAYQPADVGMRIAVR